MLNDFTKSLNQSVKDGAGYSALAALVFFLLLILWWGHVGWFVPFIETLLSVGFGILVFRLGYHTTPVGYISVLKVLGKRRRWGPDGMGLPEGGNWTPFLQIFNLGSYDNVDMREQIDKIEPSAPPPAGMPSGILEYTKGDQKTLVGLSSMLFWSIKDPYTWRSLQSPKESLFAIAVQVIRDEVMLHKNTDIITEDKDALSNKLRERMMKMLQQNGTRDDRMSLITDELVDIRLFVVRGTALPAKQNDAIVAAAASESRRTSDLQDAETLAKGVKKMRFDDDGSETGIDARSAMAALLVGLGREGAKFTHLSLPEDVVRTANVVGTKIADAVKTAAEVVGAKTDGHEGGDDHGKH